MARRTLTGTVYTAVRLSATGRAVTTARAGSYTLTIRRGTHAIIVPVTVG